MCQALSLTADVAELSDRFQLDQVLYYASNRSEANPTESVSAIIVDDRGTRMLDEFRWGLMPYWAKDSVRMDSRTMLWKPIFDRILKKQRCVIPCSGFYVSKQIGKATKRLQVTMRSGTFGIAGLYDVFRSPSGGELRTCTILMTQANAIVAPYCDQMPAILEPEDIGRWLQRDGVEQTRLHDMLRPMDSTRMIAVPVQPYGGTVDAEYDARRPKFV